MICPFCNYKPLPEKARFCLNCGASLVETSKPTASDKIIDYRELISLSTRDFVGRQWVRDAVDQFLHADGPRYFLLLGEPGCGKTTFMADIIRRRNYPHHFFGKGTLTELATALEWRNPVRFAESVGYQLVRDYGGWIMDWEDWGIHVDQKVKQLEGLLVGSEVKTFTAIPRPLDKPKLTITQEIDQFGAAAQMIGVYIDTLAMDIDQILYQLLTKPLKNIAERWPDHQVVLVVDGLDEANDWNIQERDQSREFEGAFDPPRSFIDLLPNGSLPRNVRFLLSSQPGAHLTRDFIKHGQIFWLSEDEKGNLPSNTLADAQAYVQTVIEGPKVRQFLIDKKISPDALIEKIATASQGNFLYLHHYAIGIRDGDETLVDLNAIPQGLSGIYQDFLGKIKVQRDRAVSWDRAYKPILGTLAVVQEPVTRGQIADYTGISKRTVGTILSQVGQFLQKSGRSRNRNYAIFHKSFADYLLSEENEDFIDPTEAHYGIAAYYQGTSSKWSEVAWSEVDSHYPFRHLAFHLAKANRYQELLELLTPHWISAKVERIGSFAALVPDFNVAEQAALAQKPVDFSGSIALAVARQTARELSMGLPPFILTAWLRLGYNQRVLTVLDALTAERGLAIDALIAVSVELLSTEREDTDQDKNDTDAHTAYVYLQRALAFLQSLRRGVDKLDALERILALVHGETKLTAEQRRILLEAAERFALDQGDPGVRANAIGLVAGVLAHLPENKVQVEDLLAEAERSIDLLRHSHDKLVVRASLLPALQIVRPRESMRIVTEGIKSLGESKAQFRDLAIYSSQRLKQLLKKWTPKDLPGRGKAVNQFRKLATRFPDHGFIQAYLLDVFCAMGEEEEAFTMITNTWRRYDNLAARMVTQALPALWDANPTRAKQWVYKALVFYKEEELAYSLAFIGEWERALTSLKAWGVSRYGDVLLKLMKLATHTLTDNPDRLFAVVSELVGLMGTDDKAKRAEIIALAGQSLIAYDVELATQYISVAARLALDDFPEGDTDDLRRLLAIALHESGHQDQVGSVIQSMKWRQHKMAAYGKLVELSLANPGASLDTYTNQVLAQLMSEEDGWDWFTALEKAAEVAVLLSENHPTLAERLCQRISDVATIEGCSYLKRKAKLYSQLISAWMMLDSPKGQKKFDSFVVLLNECVEDEDGVAAKTLVDIYESLAGIIAIFPDQLKGQLERLDAFMGSYDPLKVVELQSVSAVAWAPIDLSIAKSHIQNALNTAWPSEAGAMISINLWHHFSELRGRLSGDRAYQAIGMDHIGKAIVSLAEHSKLAAAELAEGLVTSIDQIEDENDCAQALATVFVNFRTAPDAFQQLIIPVYKKIIERAGRLSNAYITDYVLREAVWTYCQIGDFETARQINQSLSDDIKREDLDEKIGIIEGWGKFDELSTFEEQIWTSKLSDASFRSNLIAYYTLQEKQADSVFQLLVDMFGKDGSGIRIDLFDQISSDLFLPAFHVGGATLLKRIVEKIEAFDMHYQEAIENIAGQIDAGAGDLMAVTSPWPRHDNESALAELSRTIEERPDDYIYLFWRALVQRELMEDQAALADLSHAIELEPNSVDLHIHRAWSNQDLQDDHAALEDYTRAIELDPDNTDLYFWRGRLAFDLDQFTAAQQDFTMAIARDPDNGFFYYFRGLVNLILRDDSAADHDFSTADQIYPGEHTAFWYGVLYSLQGEDKKAEAQYQKAIELAEKAHDDCQNDRIHAKVALVRGETKLARQHYRRAFKKNCRRGSLWMEFRYLSHLVTVFPERKDIQKTKTWFRKLIK